MKVFYEKPEMIQKLEDIVEQACVEGKIITGFQMDTYEYKQYCQEIREYPVLDCDCSVFCGINISVVERG